MEVGELSAASQIDGWQEAEAPLLRVIACRRNAPPSGMVVSCDFNVCASSGPLCR